LFVDRVSSLIDRYNAIAEEILVNAFDISPWCQRAVMEQSSG
jgi:hypothetical protein